MVSIARTCPSPKGIFLRGARRCICPIPLYFRIPRIGRTPARSSRMLTETIRSGALTRPSPIFARAASNTGTAGPCTQKRIGSDAKRALCICRDAIRVALKPIHWAVGRSARGAPSAGPDVTLSLFVGSCWLPGIATAPLSLSRAAPRSSTALSATTGASWSPPAPLACPLVLATPLWWVRGAEIPSLFPSSCPLPCALCLPTVAPDAAPAACCRPRVRVLSNPPRSRFT